MTRATALGLGLLALALAGRARAQERLRDTVHWNAEICSAQIPTFTATANDPWSPAYPSQRAQVKGAWAGASWMIVREGVWAKTMNFSSTCNGNWSGGGWFDNGDELSSGWYVPQSVLVSECGPDIVGCAGIDHVDTSPSKIIAADIIISREVDWGVLNQDTVTDYTEFTQGCRSHENVWLHELGHAYGLGHNNAQISTMGDGNFCVKNINIPQTHNDQFWPLDNAQMRARYEIAAGASTRRNFSLSAFRRLPAPLGDGIDTPGPVFLTIAAPSTSLMVNYSLNRYFAASTGSVRVQFRFVPDGLEPTFNWSTLSWTWPAGTSTDLTDLQTISFGSADTAMTQTRAVSVTRADLPGPTNSWYRLWMRVDDTNAWTEIDEGDNMVPTRFYVVKS